ncbi:MAG: ABC transporter permease [Christensenellales bacterium]|jgi:peptide/nickel transport system permease protein|nr:ABC transporter permease [Eubacteriales bacterium]
MLKFIIKRLLLSAVILFFVMFLIYTVMYSLPSSYVETMARELATKPGSQKSAAQWLAELNAQYGMDKNVFEGFLTWLGQAIQGNFGDSWYYSIPVTEEFSKVIWNSFYLGVASFILEIFIAIPLGVVAARKQYSATDYSVTVVSLVGISLPTFFVATVLKLIFAVKLGWFDISGMRSRDYINMTEIQQFFDVAKHFIMPIITLTVISIGGMMRYTRTNMLEVLNSDYIRTARAKGLPERKVINRHAFRNTLIPIVTILGGSLPGLFAGALITETLFAIEGIGYASYHAMIAGDIPFTMFYLSFMAILTLLGTLIADILYAVVDPRVRIN